MNLKARLDRLENRAVFDDCPGCRLPVFHVYDPSDPDASEPEPGRCSKCGRALGVGPVETFTLSLDDRDAA